QLTKYEASALYLLGSAKLLDNLDKKALKNFGIDTNQFRQSISYVVLAGPENPEQVLLIENPQSFEACIRAGLHEYQALICTFGYGLQWSQVLERPESVVGLIRSGSANQNLKHLFSHPKVYFWGDLDCEGLNIYRSINGRLPHCQLSNLYLLMVAELHNGSYHPYTRAVEKESQAHRDGLPFLSGGVDQERFSDKDTLINFSSGGMTLSDLATHLPG
uniref:DUF2220 domain-containing protein n=1 Tax=Endozoicomonas sp. SESOKO1 TaxID=2828742 RepID=UPI0021486BA3